jgi:hypothetical protein
MHRRITIRRPDLHWVFGQRANTWHAHVTWHIARTWHMAHGTWHMAHGTWHMAHGTWHMAHGTWCVIFLMANATNKRIRADPQHTTWPSTHARTMPPIARGQRQAQLRCRVASASQSEDTCRVACGMCGVWAVGVWCVAWGVWREVCGVWWAVSGGCVVGGEWCARSLLNSLYNS